MALFRECPAHRFSAAAYFAFPLTERILRAFFDSGIQGEADFVLHFTLIVSMVGGGVAAREQRLLGISTFSQFLKGRWKLGPTSQVIPGGEA